MLVEFLLLVGAALYLFYRWSTAHFDFFEKRGIPFHKPFPLFGSMKDLVFRKKSMFDLVVDLYSTSSGKVFGIFDQRTPLFLIRDPDLLKHITIKDFDHFVNHRSIFGENTDGNLFSDSLFFLADGKWKDMRSTLSPVFTGSKMRQMFQLMNDVAQDTLKYLKKEQSANVKEGFDMDMKDYCTRFANDIIASTAFGLEVNSFENKENEFYRMGKKVTTFTAWQNFKFFLIGNFRYVMKLLKMEVFDKGSTDYFMRLVLDAMRYRKEHDIFRPDMINMLMEARGMIKSEHPKPHNREWTDTDIVAQCFLFFFAGFETASTLMCFTAHELMENPDTQQKLFEEIDEVSRELAGKPLTYETLQGMKYMDMVVSEVLRKWPAAVAIDRMCNKDFVYEVEGEKRLEIKAGEGVWIPVCGFHRDPKYYENPDKFDPERFSEENKHKIQPFTYMPFGLGPRNCIGSRFALMEAKSLLFYLVRDFRIEAAKKTSLPLVLSPSNFQLTPKDGFWLKFVGRSQS